MFPQTGVYKIYAKFWIGTQKKGRGRTFFHEATSVTRTIIVP